MVNGQWSMVNDEISQLIERFLNAQTTEAEEQTLAEYFQSVESVPEEWQPVRELFLSFQTDAYELTDSELAALTAEPAPTKRKIAPLYWFAAAAACAAILFIIGSAVLWNDAKHQNIAKIETEHKQSTPPLADPADTPPDLEGESVATTPANRMANAKFVSKRKDILDSPSTLEEESPTDKEAYQENHEPAPDLLADNSSYAPALKGTPSILEGESNLLSQRDPRLERETNAEPQAEMVVYSETDLPINNPQNLIYTEEDIQKLQEIYRQRIIAQYQSDIEISRHNLRQLKQFLASN